MATSGPHSPKEPEGPQGSPAADIPAPAVDLPEFLRSEEMTEKHWRILEAAVEVFSEKGFGASRTKEIAAAAGVSEGTIFNYFKTKKDLLTGLLLPLFVRYFRPLVAHSVEKILETGEEKNLEEILFSLMQDRIHLLRNNFPLIKTVAAEAAFHPELLDPIREKIAPYMIGLGKRFLRREKERGRIRDVDEETALRMLMSIILGYVVARHTFPDLFDWKEEEEEIRAMLDIYLHGVSGEREGGKASP
ncbi:MAG: TetR/AcrR family transcriptional regulator [Alicyclobacillaceae bacterium]|nr:TetR/AcrR family transcriptional regulator [Alicyclobacillaceae bacterium]